MSEKTWTSTLPTGRDEGIRILSDSTGYLVLINCALSAKEVFVKRPPRYQPLAQRMEVALGGNVLITSDGDEWQRTRHTIAPFFTPKFVDQHYRDAIDKVAIDTFAPLARRSRASGRSILSIDVEKTMRLITARVIGHALFNKALTVDEARYLEQRLNIATQTTKRSSSAPHAMERHLLHFSREQRQAFYEISNWIERKIARSRQKPDDYTLLGELRKRFSDQGPRRQNKSVVRECFMFFIAGMETTGATMTFAISEIAKSETLYAQVLEATKPEACEGQSTTSLRERYRILLEISEETKRKYSVVQTFVRQAGENDTISGITIPPHATIRLMAS